MQYELQIFQSQQREDLRTINIKGEPWFVLSDVCKALAIGNPSDVANRLDDDEKGVAQIDTLRGGMQNMRIINEAGLYSVILRSEKPEAKRFKKWIVSEVLPSIRKTGGYSTGSAPIAAEWQPFHDRIGTAWTVVPEGYFSIFKEMIELTGHLIVGGMKVDHQTIPDISLGMAWAKHWVDMGYDHEYGFRITYEHNYPPSFPQAKSNPQWPYCYPEDAISVFRRWVRNVYLKEGLPKYLKGQVSSAKIDATKAAALMKAVQATLPVPGSALALPRR